MAAYKPIKNSFVAGELSPRMEGRDDLEQYHQGMRVALNGIVLPHGGFLRRSGTHFVATTKTQSENAVLIPFQFSTEQAYMCEFGDLYARFYVNEGQLDSGGPVEVVTPYLHTELRDLQFTQEADIMWVVHPNHPPYKLTRTSLTAFSFTKVLWTDGRAPMRASNVSAITITVTGAGPFTLTASAPLWVTAGSLFDDVERTVRIKETADEGWFRITSIGSSTVATADKDGGATPTGATTDFALGMFSDEEGARAVTFHEARLAYGGSNFSKDRYVLSDSDNFDKFDNDATMDDDSIARRTTSGQVNAIQWLVSADEKLSIGTSGGEFKAVGANDDIMTPTGTVTKPTTSRGSKHTLPVLIDNQVIFIQRNGKKLRELKFDLNVDALIARDVSILAEHILEQGAIELRFQQDPDSVIWAVRGDGTLVSFTFEAEQRVIGGARHQVGGSFSGEIAVVESVGIIPKPDETEDQLWMIVKRTVDGATKRYVEFMEEQFRPLITVQSTQQESIDVMEDAWFVDSGLELDSPFVITNITQADPGIATTSAAHGFSNGNQVRIVEVVGMTEVNRTNFLVANVTSTTFELQDLSSVNVDTTGFTAYSSGGEVRKMVTSVSNLGHLEGETVQILLDGAVHPDKVVSSSSVTFDRPGAKARIGLKYVYEGETQRFTGGGTQGTDQGELANIKRCVIRLQNTLGLQVGTGPNPTGDNLERLLFREPEDPMDQSPPLFSGDKDIPVPGGWGRVPTIYFRQDQPLPATVLSIMPRVESGNR